MTERLFGVVVVAKRLKRCPTTIRRYIRTGRLLAIRGPGTTRGGNYRIPESSILDFLGTSERFLGHSRP